MKLTAKKRKKGGGAKPGTFNPRRKQFTDIRYQLIYGHPEWRMVRLRELILAQKKEEAAAIKEMLLTPASCSKSMIVPSSFSSVLR